MTVSTVIPEPESLHLHLDEYLDTHPVTIALRDDPKYIESRPHARVPEELRVHNLITGTFVGAHKISVPPYVFTQADGKSMVMLLHLGDQICGHPGIIHGGFLATLLDEGLARCCFGALPSKVGVTANLNINYRQPAPANAFFVLRAETRRVEGRKAWVDGRIEVLDHGQESCVVVEATALFIEPRQTTVSGFQRRAECEVDESQALTGLYSQVDSLMDSNKPRT
ncbi:thioesterase family protein [Penicillium capsulatum]|uniref:Thioesterase family protein n=1 Tax=Penicillium capsulatum TaxID=69766 RepID=A0A9W9IJH3_9EURO|nr:thioesterase family protein [Penicillium capsulatum]KAJ6121984.1 thioesterase family protein [Penicillium capsulatum]